jgi:hypothetical protein
MTLTGYILPETAADAVLDAIASAFDVRGLPRFWSPGKYLIHHGDHAGLYFLPADDSICDAPLLGSPVQRPRDFPEFSALVESLGGLESRVEIDSSEILTPE